MNTKAPTPLWKVCARDDGPVVWLVEIGQQLTSQRMVKMKLEHLGHAPVRPLSAWDPATAKRVCSIRSCTRHSNTLQSHGCSQKRCTMLAMWHTTTCHDDEFMVEASSEEVAIFGLCMDHEGRFSNTRHAGVGTNSASRALPNFNKSSKPSTWVS